MDLAGTVAFVTGGISGLGAGAARQLLRRGARVVAFDRVESRRGAAAARELGESCLFVQGDVTVEQDVQTALDVAAELGPVRLAVNCAGVGGRIPLVGDAGPFPLSDFRRIVEVNLVGTFNVMRLAATRMAALDPVQGERGVIVNTASTAAFEGINGHVAYSASKAGVAGMALPAARDMGVHLIRIMNIAPGAFRTPMLGAMPEPLVEALLSQVPHPSRLGEPDEFGALVVHIAENPMLNGETIRLDGAVRQH